MTSNPRADRVSTVQSRDQVVDPVENSRNETKLHGTWLEYMRALPPPPFPSFVQPFRVEDSVTQHTQLLLRNVPEAPTQLLLRRKDSESPTQLLLRSVPESSTQPTQLLLRKDIELSTQPPTQFLMRKNIVSATQPQHNVQFDSKMFGPKRAAEQVCGEGVDRHSAAKVPSTEPSVNSAGNTLFIEIKIGKKRCSALLDTGSEVTLLPKHLADLTQLNRASRKLRAANGTKINIIGEWRTTVTMGPLRVRMNFIVSDQIDELLVGIDWMRENGCGLSFADLTIELKGYRFPLHRKTNEGKRYVEQYTIVRKTSELSKPVKDSEENRHEDVCRDEFKCGVKSFGNNSGIVTNAIWSCYLQDSQMPMSTNAEDRPFRCRSCDRSFKRLFDLNRHDRAKHLKIGVLCPLCQKRLSAVDVLRKHLKTQHPDPPTSRMRVSGGGRRSPSAKACCSVSQHGGEQHDSSCIFKPTGGRVQSSCHES